MGVLQAEVSVLKDTQDEFNLIVFILINMMIQYLGLSSY